MSKRQDSGYIKRVVKSSHSAMVRKFTSGLDEIPLLVMEKTSKIYNTFKKDLHESMMGAAIDNCDVAGLQNLASIVPVQNMVILDTTVDVEKFGAGYPHNYFRFMINGGGTCSINYYTPSGEVGVLLVDILDSNELTYKCVSVSNDNGIQPADEDQTTFLVMLLMRISVFMQTLHESDLYPIETKGVQHRKVHAKKPWQRSDLVTIQFLNRLPVEKQSHKGGTHSSPRYHQRRGAWRSMANPRFKNHPKYGDRIWVKPYWAGEKEATVNGVTYKVL